MKVISWIAQKGGSGKTTLAVNVSLAAVRAKKTVFLIDLDPQKSSLAWFNRRSEEKQGDIIFTESNLANLPGFLKWAKNKKNIDFVVIDTAGHADKIMPEVAKVSDLILVPCVPTSLFDIDAMTQTFHIFRLSRTPAVIVFNKCRAESFASDMKANLEQGGFEVVPVVVPSRAGFEWSIFQGQGIQEYEEEKSKGAKAINDLFSYVCERLKL